MGGRYRGNGHTLTVLRPRTTGVPLPSTRARNRLLAGALLCVVVFVAITVLYETDLRGLDRVDRDLGTWPQHWTFDHRAATRFLLFVELVFGTLWMAAYTAVAAGLLTWRRHVRAAVWTVGVMLCAGLTTFLLKGLLHRKRPVWPDPVTTLSSFSFPSGHATGVAAAAGVTIVLAAMFVRRRNLRRLLYAAAVLVALLVGADRIFLGVHNPSDVLAGYSVGVFWVLVGLVVYDPAPRPRQLEAFATPVPTTRQVALVLNPVKVEDPATFRTMVERAAQEAGWTFTGCYETTVEDPGRTMAEQAAISGAELVVVCGGDGTVRTVCAELAGTGVSVGVVPAGTGNLLARNLGVPLYLQAAVDVALNGQDRAIDLVKVAGDGLGDDEHFMVMAGMGFDAAIMEGANETIKAKVGWLAYVVSALRNLMFPPVRVEISVDGGDWSRHRVRTVVVGNVGYLQAGMPLLPDATLDDGVLDVVMLHPRRFLSWIPLVVRVLSRQKRVDDTLNRMTGRTVSLRAASDTPRQLDGDSIGPGRELHCECIHGKLLVRVPR
ncbi:MAG: phosphatase PAP2 family protein [Nocardioidaceae bacterium]|nr:phosphatase PAP2 family protein [Nocardioidaceae bacterium]NUS52295.1 phosphatase PAP2 family protein [Nocardioidaceae bacterium]